MSKIDDCPQELAVSIKEFFPADQWENAAAVSELESEWDAFALNDTASQAGGCGKSLRVENGVWIYSERSVGYFQINACNFPGWEWQRLYNARHNAGTAHMIWTEQGWSAWWFTSGQLGLR